MKPCEEYRELISARIDGELSPVDARRLEEHLASCDACRRELAEQERVWQGLEAMGEARVPEGLADRVYAAAMKGGNARHWAVPRWAWSVGGLAAAVLIVVALGLHLPTGTSSGAGRLQIVSDMGILQDLDVLEHIDGLDQIGEGLRLTSAQISVNESGL